MKRIFALIAAAGMIATPLFANPALAQNRERARTDEQTSAREHMQAGRNMPIREIERRIIPQMRDDEYLGFEYDETAQAYRLKFIREGKMIWVDVDARNARVLRVSR